MSRFKMTNDYDGITHDYSHKHDLVYENVYLPSHAPPEWKDRSILWNSVEASEKTKDSRLSRELIVALPTELTLDENIAMLERFIKEQFVSDGMCADVGIHDTDGHNPHAHIMLTVRPLKTDGTWQAKTEKEYLCKRGSEEKTFTAFEFLSAKKQGSVIFCSQFEPKGWIKRIVSETDATLAEATLDRFKHSSYIIDIKGDVSMRERHGLKSKAVIHHD